MSLPCGTRISAAVKDLTTFQVDAIVITTDENISLNYGIGKLMLQKGKLCQLHKSTSNRGKRVEYNTNLSGKPIKRVGEQKKQAPLAYNSNELRCSNMCMQ